MTAEMVTRTIQFILAPVVMITACTLLLSGMVAHYYAINTRLRTFARERFDLLRIISGNKMDEARIRQIDLQLPMLLSRHKTVRNAILANYLAILVLIGDMFVIALAVMTNADAFAQAALYIFLASTLALFTGVLIIALEVRISHQTVENEIENNRQLGK